MLKKKEFDLPFSILTLCALFLVMILIAEPFILFKIVMMGILILLVGLFALETLDMVEEWEVFSQFRGVEELNSVFMIRGLRKLLWFTGSSLIIFSTTLLTFFQDFSQDGNEALVLLSYIMVGLGGFLSLLGFFSRYIKGEEIRKEKKELLDKYNGFSLVLIIGYIMFIFGSSILVLSTLSLSRDVYSIIFYCSVLAGIIFLLIGEVIKKSIRSTVILTCCSFLVLFGLFFRGSDILTLLSFDVNATGRIDLMFYDSAQKSALVFFILLSIFYLLKPIREEAYRKIMRGLIITFFMTWLLFLSLLVIFTYSSPFLPI